MKLRLSTLPGILVFALATIIAAGLNGCASKSTAPSAASGTSAPAAAPPAPGQPPAALVQSAESHAAALNKLKAAHPGPQ